MATTGVREGHLIGSDAGGRAIQNVQKPALAVHFLNTVGPQTVKLDDQTTVVRIQSSVTINSELAGESPDSAAGAKRGTIPAVAMRYLLPVTGRYALAQSE